MNIIVIHKNSIACEPPTQTVVQTLSDLGFTVKLITLSLNDYWRDELSKRKIETYNVDNESYLLAKNRNLLFKIKTWYNYRRFVLNILSKQPSDSILWFVDADSFTPLVGSVVFSRFKYILHILETYDHSKLYKKVINKYANGCYKMIVCEEHRAALFNMWFKLRQYPLVLPNKPYSLPRCVDSIDFVKSKSEKLYKSIKSGKKIVLYQGVISDDRDLFPIVKAVRALGDDFVFVIMGRDYGPLSKYLEFDKSIIYINQISAPQHLIITSIAYIGVLMYDPISLNQIFCAPNKIFEYSGYSIPMIGNNIPGLSIPFERFGAGEIFDASSIESITQAILRIDTNLTHYKTSALKLYNSIDMPSLVKKMFNI